MLSTLVFASLFFGVLLTEYLLWAWLLRMGLRWTRVPDVTKRRLVIATVTVFVLNFCMNALFLTMSSTSNVQSILLAFVELAAAIIMPCLVISLVFRIGFARAIQGWLPTLLASCLAMISLVMIRLSAFEAFTVTTNAMAPTLVGKHWQGKCSECNSTSFCSPRDERYPASDAPLMICENFHVFEAPNPDKRVYACDRFMVAKFLTLQRWDLVAFQYPADPATLYVKRLVGLPGEKIHIEDGSIWVDGKKQTPPKSIGGIKYSSDLPERRGQALWGSPSRPALLGDDEYFVVGDFSVQSSDSRTWESGAAGHNPFAVPRANMKGVVTHTFWPPSRLRIHR